MNPISNEDIKQRLQAEFSDAEVHVDGDGYKYTVTIVSEKFSDLSTVKRHQQVYAVLNEAITSGSLHALTLKTFSADEWAENKS